MFAKLLAEYLYLVQMAALLVASGILILGAARDVFEMEAVDEGAPSKDLEYRYMSDAAQHARFELTIVANLLRWVLTVFSFVVVITFLVFILFDFLNTWFPMHTSASCATPPGRRFYCDFFAMLNREWQSFSSISVLHNVFGGVFILIGPIFLYELANVVHHVVQARINYKAGKRKFGALPAAT